MNDILKRINKGDQIRARFLGLGVAQMLANPAYYADSFEQCAIVLKKLIDDLDHDELLDWNKDLDSGFYFSFESKYNGTSDINKKYALYIR